VRRTQVHRANHRGILIARVNKRFESRASTASVAKATGGLPPVSGSACRGVDQSGGAGCCVTARSRLAARAFHWDLNAFEAY